MAPQGAEDIVAELPQALEPGALGQGGQDTRGEILVPSPCTRQLMGTAAPKERGKHEAEDFPEELLLGAQTAFDPDDEVIGDAKIIKGLVERLDIPLGLALLVYMAFLSIKAAPFDSFRLLVSVSS